MNKLEVETIHEHADDVRTEQARVEDMTPEQQAMVDARVLDGWLRAEERS